MILEGITNKYTGTDKKDKMAPWLKFLILETIAMIPFMIGFMEIMHHVFPKFGTPPIGLGLAPAIISLLIGIIAVAYFDRLRKHRTYS